MSINENTFRAVFLLLVACSLFEHGKWSMAQEFVPESAITLGEVDFRTTCAANVKASFNTAVAMLHSFEFDESRRVFEQVASEDSNCAMAYWGVAMTYYHPLWAPPSDADLLAGSRALRSAQEISNDVSLREQGYIGAIASFYSYEDGTSHRERALRYEEAMADVVSENPSDSEAEIFYALARLSNADPTDKTYELQKQVGAMLEQKFSAMPNHPGLAHYIIHSFDYPEIAESAVHAADRYLEIATSMPHALHMSGHIYTQLGLWDRSVDANILSVDAAVARAEIFSLGEGTQNELHSLDYLVYAYLQLGLNDKALEVVERVASFSQLDLKDGIIAFNSSAVPVRYAMERQDWEAAANIPLLDEEAKESWNDQLMNSQALRE